MKKNNLFTFLAAMLLLSACSTDFELEAEWKDIPVVYSFFSLQDTAHYVRVEKVFLEPGGNALEIAKITDSIYYQDLTVELQNLTTGQSFVMQRVDGAGEGYPKDDGLFASEPNVLYKLPAEAAKLKGGDNIRLVINRGDNTEPAIAETRIIDEVVIRQDSPPDRIARTRFTNPQRIVFTPDENARIFDLRFDFHYLERLPGETAFTRKTATWVVDRELSIPDNDGSSVIYEANWEAFYQALATQIPRVDGAGRFFDSMDFFVTGAGDELYQFVRVSRANTGITSAQSIPTYSNVEGGLGIVTSRYTAGHLSIVLADEALDSLRTGIYTRNLNFN